MNKNPFLSSKNKGVLWCIINAFNIQLAKSETFALSNLLICAIIYFALPPTALKAAAKEASYGKLIPVFYHKFPNPAVVYQRDLTAPLSELEKELAPIAYQILNHESIEHKDSLNQIFIGRMSSILKRLDSYDYRFDSLKTISRIYPEDNTFRVFSWGVTDADRNRTYRNTSYYGFVQRKYTYPNKTTKIFLSQLHDRRGVDAHIESKILAQDDWLGALYYTPKNTPTGVLSLTGTVYKSTALKGKRKKHKIKYYILFGLNQNDIYTNYKVLDVLSIDPKDTTQVLFGAPLFYINGYPHCRRLFKYSDNSPFSLNYHYVTTSKAQEGITHKKKKMIVFDHLAMQNVSAGKSTQYAVGADGTTDAFYFVNKTIRDERKGFFIYVKNVKVYIPETAKYSPKKLRRQALKEKRRIHYTPNKR